ncbi:hypothetical protein O181_109991 [Austropuccinia psidii MF-1]|uniref:CCHC-type domain-containing protein n=1 Tax=Austropuccinia psidii MF-1 TaxID=1389203 RepID=A0A9Q3PRD3_9BASI|nr:hypothetical protein [Austropuccinia psidii MF-1]
MIQQNNISSPSFDYSTNLAWMNDSFPGQNPKRDSMKSRSASEPQNTMPSSNQTAKKKKIYDPSSPCYYCGELGYWTPTCPVKITANDARLKIKEHSDNAESFDTTPLIEYLEESLDSGATHSVVGNPSFFT